MSKQERSGKRPGGGPSGIGQDSLGEALKELIIEATRLHYHVVSASRGLARAQDLTNGQVSLLRSLAAQGPCTVPELARERAIARQPVQRMTLELEALGLVTFEANPRHRRSRLVTPTARGKRKLRAMERRQTALAGSIGRGFSERSIRSATRVLRRVRERTHSLAPAIGDRS